MTLESLPYGVALAEELHHLGSFRDVPFEWDTLMRNSIMGLNHPMWFYEIAKDDNDTYCGIMVGHMDTFMFSTRLLAIENCIYVRKGTPKRTRIGIQMVKNFINWAFDHGATHVQCGDIAGIDSLAIDEFYRHLGFSRYGTIYKYSRPGGIV